MEDLLIFALFMLAGLPIFAIPATWLFGLRPFVAQHGCARITAVNWLLSMWADWTTAREIEKKTGRRTWSTKLFFCLWAYVVLLYGGCFVLLRFLP